MYLFRRKRTVRKIWFWRTKWNRADPPCHTLSGPRVINTLVPDDDLTETYTGLTTSPSNRYLAASSNLFETIEVGSSNLFNNTIYSMLDGSRLCTVSQTGISPALNRSNTHSAAYDAFLALQASRGMD